MPKNASDSTILYRFALCSFCQIRKMKDRRWILIAFIIIPSIFLCARHSALRAFRSEALLPPLHSSTYPSVLTAQCPQVFRSMLSPRSTLYGIFCGLVTARRIELRGGIIFPPLALIKNLSRPHLIIFYPINS